MAFFRCAMSNSSNNQNDLYVISRRSWDPNSVYWTAPRNGTVKVWVEVKSAVKGINDVTATATFLNITAKAATYATSDKNGEPQDAEATGTANVTKGTRYQLTMTNNGTSPSPSYGGAIAVLTYID